MRRIAFITVVSTAALAAVAGPGANPFAQTADVPRDKQIPAKVILENLATKKNEDLREYLSFLDYKLDKSYLSNEEIDRIIEKLREVQKSDSYRKEISLKRGTKLAFPNRRAAEPCIFRFRFQKIANRLRALPMEQRVAAIVEGMLEPPELGYGTTGSFANELVAAGKPAVPFIIEHKPEQPYVRRHIVKALAEIGDPRGVPYLIEVLQNDAENFRSARVDAAAALGDFQGEKVVAALIAALEDPTYQKVDKHLTQVPSPTHKPYVARYYAVQHAASKSLSQITGKNWGLVYNEDHTTWAAWVDSKDREAFRPQKVERTEQEKKALVESLFHRSMSGRPNPWQPQNELAEPEGIRSIAKDLEPLGESVVPMLVEVCNGRIAQTPLWRAELTQWTQQLLRSLPWDSAARAAEGLRKRPATRDGD